MFYDGREDGIMIRDNDRLQIYDENMKTGDEARGKLLFNFEDNIIKISTHETTGTGTGRCHYLSRSRARFHLFL